MLIEGRATNACLKLVVKLDGASVTTVGGLAATDGTLSPVQATVAHAVFHATGSRVRDLPITIDKLLASRTSDNLINPKVHAS